MMPKQLIKQKILYAVLDWGYGHVTRSIGIIRELVAQENHITLACNSEQELLFKSYFPDVNYVQLEGYQLSFGGKGNWSWDLWKQRRSFLKTIQLEHHFVNDFCQKNDIDVIISDHRYGFYSGQITSIFVTHQLHLPISNFFFFIQAWHEKQLRKFSTIWVLDDKQSCLAGKLSKSIQHPSLCYIGWKSRFLKQGHVPVKFDYLIVISGPKPYSEQFLDEILLKLNFTDKKVAIIHPISVKILTQSNNFTLFKTENLREQDQLFYESETIISRAGYSTLMDLKILDKKGILFPTKGQKEQEYLAEYNKLNF